MRLSLVLALGLVAAAACGRSSEDDQPTDLCQSAVDHVMTLVNGGFGDAKVSASERLAMDTARSASLAKCRAEGITQAQADCILAARTFEQFMAMGTCPALRDKKPSWLILAPTLE